MAAKNTEIEEKNTRILELETENSNLQTQLQEKITLLESLQTEKNVLEDQVATLSFERDNFKNVYENIYNQFLFNRDFYTVFIPSAMDNFFTYMNLSVLC